MRIVEKEYEIHNKIKNGEKLTIDEQMFKDMSEALSNICCYIIAYDKGSTVDYIINKTRDELGLFDKDYK